MISQIYTFIDAFKNYSFIYLIKHLTFFTHLFENTMQNEDISTSEKFIVSGIDIFKI